MMMAILLCCSSQVQADQSGDYTYTATAGETQITGYTGAGGDVTIPSTLGGFPVTSIGDAAFYGAGLTSISIPQGVTSIGHGAFAYCYGLTAITVAADNLFYKSIDGVLYNKAGTILIVCPARLTTVSIPQGVTSIDDSAFADCTGLTSMSIPEGVTSIGICAFAGCYGLTTISIPQGVTSIGGWTFDDCIGLTSISIPKGITSIGEYAFYLCTSLTSITINSATTAIYDSADTIPAATKIIGYDPSTAKDYATKYNRTFEVIAPTAPISETLTVSNPAPTGFTVALNPALTGLTASNFTLLDSSNQSVTITGATTSDSGATYEISAALCAGQTYTVTAAKTGYDFGAPVNVGCVPDNLEEFTTEFDSIKATGGEMTLHGDIALDGVLTLSAEKSVTIHAGKYRIVTDDTKDSLEVGSNVTIEGDGFNDSNFNDHKYGVVAADGGGFIKITGGTVKSNASQGAAVYLHGTWTNKGSSFSMTSGAIIAGDAACNARFGIYARKFSEVTISGGTITVNGDCGIGIDINGENLPASATLDGGTINITGKEGYGVYVRGGASGHINACTINANEQDGVGVSAYGCSNITVGGASVVINANGQNGHALEASHGSSVTILDGTTISATGDNGIGVEIGLGGDGFISGGTIAAKYRGVNIVGEDVYAQATISGGTITVTGTEGIGINAQSTGFLDENGNNIQDEGERDCVVRFSGGTVVAAGEESTGLVAFGCGKAEISGPATINATGLKSTCVYASNGGYIKISAGTITASGDNSTVISVHLGGLVEIVSSIVSITGSGNNDVCLYSEDLIGTACIIMPDMAMSVYLEGAGANAKIADNTITALEGKTVIVGTAYENLNLPTTVSDCDITWAPGCYDGNTPGEYVIYGHLTNPINVQNVNISLGIKITVVQDISLTSFDVEREEDGPSLQINAGDDFWASINIEQNDHSGKLMSPVTNLASFQGYIAYDSDRLEVLEVVPGELIPASGWTLQQGSQGADGVYVELTGPQGDTVGLSGYGKLLRVHFRSLSGAGGSGIFALKGGSFINLDDEAKSFAFGGYLTSIKGQDIPVISDYPPILGISSHVDIIPAAVKITEANPQRQTIAVSFDQNTLDTWKYPGVDKIRGSISLKKNENEWTVLKKDIFDGEVCFGWSGGNKLVLSLGHGFSFASGDSLSFKLEEKIYDRTTNSYVNGLDPVETPVFIVPQTLGKPLDLGQWEGMINFGVEGIHLSYQGEELCSYSSAAPPTVKVLFNEGGPVVWDAVLRAPNGSVVGFWGYGPGQSREQEIPIDLTWESGNYQLLVKAFWLFDPTDTTMAFSVVPLDIQQGSIPLITGRVLQPDGSAFIRGDNSDVYVKLRRLDNSGDDLCGTGINNDGSFMLGGNIPTGDYLLVADACGSNNPYANAIPVTIHITVGQLLTQDISLTNLLITDYSATPLVQIGINPEDGDSVGIFVGLENIKDQNGNTINPNVAGYQIKVDFDPTKVAILDVLDEAHLGQFIKNVDSVAGKVYIADAVAIGTSNYNKLFFLPITLIGSALDVTSLQVHFINVRDPDNNQICVDNPSDLEFHRGKIYNEGPETQPNIADAVAGLQYLAGLRNAGADLEQVNLINMASILPPEPVSGVLRPSIKDVIVLMQYLVGLRDDSFQLVSR